MRVIMNKLLICRFFVFESMVKDKLDNDLKIY